VGWRAGHSRPPHGIQCALTIYIMPPSPFVTKHIAVNIHQVAFTSTQTGWIRWAHANCAEDDLKPFRIAQVEMPNLQCRVDDDTFYDLSRLHFYMPKYSQSCTSKES
jgi:hypothetical protein